MLIKQINSINCHFFPSYANNVFQSQRSKGEMSQYPSPKYRIDPKLAK